MIESARPQREEYVNPRPLILTLCFAWGIAMGFLLNFFRQPETAGANEAQPAPSLVVKHVEAAGGQPGVDRRLEGAPTIAAIEPTLAVVAGEKLSFENTTVPLPSVSLSTEGGLTGRIAALPRSQPRPSRRDLPQQTLTPLIPDLDP
ncbi:MAG: hypothetical protein LBT97_08210 [Planctomycetota bacterium]|nr:hypothetical protein [Planctomycetota bacterium]